MILMTRSFIIGLFSLLGVVSQGCSSPPVMSESQDDAFGKMMAIQECYLQHSMQNGRAPTSIEDLQTTLSEAGYDKNEILKSSRDGSELTVHWGVMPDVQTTEPVVIGYEGNSQEGRRVVMTSTGVWLMTDDEFYASSFPPGHQPPARTASSN